MTRVILGSTLTGVALIFAGIPALVADYSPTNLVLLLGAGVCAALSIVVAEKITKKMRQSRVGLSLWS